MPYKGHIENGVILPDEPLDLPDGAVVEFHPVKLPSGHHHPDVERFAGVVPQAACTEDYINHLRKKHA